MCTDIWVCLFSFLNSSFGGAFFGAFFAFIFGLIAYDYTKKREKWVSHHNALVSAEQLINRHLNDIGGNTFLLKGAVETFTMGAFTENLLHPLENPDFLLEFQNIQLINKYMDYQSMVVKINGDLEAWNRSVTRLFDVAISGRVDKDSIDKNREHIKARSEEMILHLKDLTEMGYEIGGYVRAFMKKDKRDWLARLGKTAEINLTDKQVEAERKQLIRESNETTEKDKKRTAKFNY